MQKKGMKQETIDKIDFIKSLILLDKNPDYIAVQTGLSSLGSVGGVRNFLHRHAEDFMDELNAWTTRHKNSISTRKDTNVKSDNRDLTALFIDVNYGNAHRIPRCDKENHIETETIAH